MCISENNLNDITSRNNLKYHYSRCQKEIEKMQVTFVGNSVVLFYDILISNNLSQLAAYAKNEEIKRTFKLKSYKMLFPVFTNRLNYQFTKGLWRKILENKVRGFFNAVSNIKGNENLPRLPTVCIDKIFSYFRNRELRILILICKFDLGVEISDINI